MFHVKHRYSIHSRVYQPLGIYIGIPRYGRSPSNDPHTKSSVATPKGKKEGLLALILTLT